MHLIEHCDFVLRGDTMYASIPLSGAHSPALSYYHRKPRASLSLPHTAFRFSLWELYLRHLRFGLLPTTLCPSRARALPSHLVHLGHHHVFECHHRLPWPAADRRRLQRGRVRDLLHAGAHSLSILILILASKLKLKYPAASLLRGCWLQRPAQAQVSALLLFISDIPSCSC